ncbi:MAG TPA: SUMF1/EgtB/PvdO family nonheme iron enzyme [Anaerolineales bacterium]|nr:SUMF1/EgtB/PvdO family nonheme iron enzyme [Anaerolineales bacterium]
MSKQNIYTVGGTVQAGGGIYIKRKADDELLDLCRQSEFAFILSSRQVGKSSLIVRTAQQLESENIRSVTIDLSAIGVKVSPDEWYLGILNEIYIALELKTDIFAWWLDHAKLGPAQRLTNFFKDVLLKEVKEQIVLFFDEIDSTLSIPFSDDFYVAIRAVYNARATIPDFKRLSFVLVGVATPSDLISDNKRTPFNIGRRVEINDFNLTEAFPLVENFGIQAAQILTWVFQYTGGHPYLTQRLFAHLAKSREVIDEETIAHAVERLFTGEQGRQDNNLQFVRDMLSGRSPDVRRVLRTYKDIRSGRKILDDERSMAKAHLKLSGLVRSDKGLLRVRNEIYKTVFNPQWIQENTPKSWQKTAFMVLGVTLGILLLGTISLSLKEFLEPPAPSLPTTDIPVAVQTTAVPFTATVAFTNTPELTASPALTFTPSGPLPEIKSHNVVMVLVPAGTFQMGAVKRDLNALSDEKPSHPVDLPAYYIDKFEVTNALYKVCADEGKCKPPIQTDSYTHFKYYGNPTFDDYPVVWVNWTMANNYCTWREARLPTEAEWEKAAHGPNPHLYPWGDTEPACPVVNFNGPHGCDNDVHEIGSFEAGKSPYGVYDMAGNVWEWVADWYSQVYYGISPMTNPTGPNSGQGKVLRGGAWNSSKDDIRTSKRRSFPTNGNNFNLGFRCAQDVKP